MLSRIAAIGAILCAPLSACTATIAGTANPGPPVPLATAEALPSFLLSASDVGAVMSSGDIAVVRDVGKFWNDAARLDNVDCLAVAGSAQERVYAGSGATATHSQVLREPPTSPNWSHYAVQAVVLFPTSQAALAFYEKSRRSWGGCSERELSYPQPIGEAQRWSVGSISSDHDVLAVSRIEQAPDRWSCQRALTVHSNVAIDVEACSLEGAPTAATAIARQIATRLPAA